jgi:hypothetical protein
MVRGWRERVECGVCVVNDGNRVGLMCGEEREFVAVRRFSWRVS